MKNGLIYRDELSIFILVMAFSLMVKGKDRGYADRLNFDDWDELDREIDNLSKKN